MSKKKRWKVCKSITNEHSRGKEKIKKEKKTYKNKMRPYLEEPKPFIAMVVMKLNQIKNRGYIEVHTIWTKPATYKVKEMVSRIYGFNLYYTKC